MLTTALIWTAVVLFAIYVAVGGALLAIAHEFASDFWDEHPKTTFTIIALWPVTALPSWIYIGTRAIIFSFKKNKE